MKAYKLLFITLTVLGSVMTQNPKFEGFFDPKSIFGDNGFNFFNNGQGQQQQQQQSQ